MFTSLNMVCMIEIFCFSFFTTQPQEIIFFQVNPKTYRDRNKRALDPETSGLEDIPKQGRPEKDFGVEKEVLHRYSVARKDEYAYSKKHDETRRVLTGSVAAITRKAIFILICP